MDDGHIRDLIYRLESDRRPRWYIVDPRAEQEDVSYWATQNVDLLKCTFGKFMDGLDKAIPELFRVLSPAADVVDFPLRKFYATNADESPRLRASIAKDLTLVRAGMAYKDQSPQKFYSGYDTGWGGIIKRLDVRRKISEVLLFKVLLENEHPTEPVFFLLQGPGGAGKTIALKRAAMDAATANDALVLWLEESGALHPEVFTELFELCKVPIYLFVDEVALHAEKLVSLLSTAKDRNIPLVVIGAEREADWSTYCTALEDRYPPQFLRVGNLSESEVDGLLDLLERHGCLGLLKDKSREKQVEDFMAAEKADRQLLVALHELTLGKPFEEIVLSEHNRVNPEQARSLYLDIASMHQFSVNIRAGTISRISGIDFLDYKDKFLSPLKDIVKVEIDRYTGDYCYKTRHPRIAALVFRQVCPDDASKASQLRRLLQGLDAGYSSDHRALEGICRGRALAENFAEVGEVREIYELAVSIAPAQAFLHQQWAIFESSHRKGSIILAEQHAATARELDPRNRVIVHTQAEVARKRACLEASSILKDQLRRQTRAFLAEMPSNDRFATSTRCKLLVDETVELGVKTCPALNGGGASEAPT